MPDRPQELDFSSDVVPDHLPVLREKAYTPEQKRAVDFTDDAVPQRIPLLQERAYDPEPRREATRGWLAASLLFLVLLCVAAGIAFIAVGKLPGAALVESILPQVVTLAASALGFYFGIQRAANVRTRRSSDRRVRSPKSYPRRIGAKDHTDTRL